MLRKKYILAVLALLVSIGSSVGVVEFNGKKFLKVTVMQEDGTIAASFFPSFDDAGTTSISSGSKREESEQQSEIQQSKKEASADSEKDTRNKIPSPSSQNRYKIHKSKGSAKTEKPSRSYLQASPRTTNSINEYKVEEKTPANDNFDESQKIEQKVNQKNDQDKNLRRSWSSTNIGQEDNDIIGERNRIYGKENLIRGNINYVTENSSRNQIHGDGNHVDGYGNIIYSY